MDRMESLECEMCGARYFDNENILNIEIYDMCCNCMELMAFDNADEGGRDE